MTKEERLQEAAQAHLRQPYEHIFVAKTLLQSLVEKIEETIPEHEKQADLSYIYTKGAAKYLELWDYAFGCEGGETAGGAKAIADWRQELYNMLKAACLKREEWEGRKPGQIIEMLGKSHARVEKLENTIDAMEEELADRAAELVEYAGQIATLATRVAELEQSCLRYETMFDRFREVRDNAAESGAAHALDLDTVDHLDEVIEWWLKGQ